MDATAEKPTPGLDLYWRIAVRRRWWILVPFALGWAAVLGASWIIPPKYRSESLILVQHQQVSDQYVTPNVTMDIASRMNTLTEQILSRKSLLAIADKYNLYPAAKSTGDPDQITDALRKDISIDLQTSNTTKKGDLTAFTLSYVNHNPQVAQQVTNELTSLFIDTSMKHGLDIVTSTNSFLQRQLEIARKDLDDQEGKLKQFKTQYLGELPEQLQSNLQILSGLQARLQAATNRLNSAEQQRVYLESLRSQYKAAANQASSADVPVTPAVLDDELSKLHQELTALQAKYTDKHPDVIRVKGEIKAAEALKAKVDAQLAAADQAPASKRTSPVQLQAQAPLMQVESQLKSTDLEITNERAEVRSMNSEISQYQGRLNLTPMREQQLAGIIRDHDQSQKNYDDLLKKTQQSELATSLESQQQGDQFRLIDPPSLPLKPYFPDRLKMAIAGIGFGLFLGVVIAGIAEYSDLRIYTDTQVKNLVGAPMMVVGVPALWTHSEIDRNRRSAWMQTAIASVLLLAIMSVTALTVLFG
ncbi:MAG: hypothetical protein ACRD3Q_01205 [Terriglobales bacterium]